MTSFNVVDYVPASAIETLFNGILRQQWGFNGLVVTDYTAVNEMMQHGIGDLQTVSALSLKAGVDMDMVGDRMLRCIRLVTDLATPRLNTANLLFPVSQ